MWMMTLQIGLVLVSLLRVESCTTLVAGRRATVDGSVLAAHSNDGDGVTVGNLMAVPAANWTLPASRAVSGGSIPQVAETYAYFTKVGGYASFNEKNVGLAESTCSAVFPGSQERAALNIVDLSALGLERADTARLAVSTMGQLAEQYGYYDAGESLLVVDPEEAYIFHVLPDDSGTSAIWVAQRVPDDHVGVVANSFTVRQVNLTDEQNYLYSANMLDVARSSGRWDGIQKFDFTRVFAAAEPGHKYASGRRMWAAFHQLALPAMAADLPAEYDEYVSSAPYPATLPAANLTAARLRNVMRSYYRGTPYDLSAGQAAGPFGSPARWSVPVDAVGNFERPIAIQRTILSYVLVCRRWLPEEVGGVMWISFHSALYSVYMPLTTGSLHSSLPLPRGLTANSGAVDRGIGAWQAAHFVFAAAQIHFTASLARLTEEQSSWEAKGERVVAAATADFVAGQASNDEVSRHCFDHVRAAVAAWWQLSDSLLLSTSYPALRYPSWWLNATGYAEGPPPSPKVPPIS